MDRLDSLGTRTALLAMDLQRDFLQPGGRWPIDRGQIDQVIATMNQALVYAARVGLPVIYVVNAFDLLDPANLTRNFCALRGSAGGTLDPRITIVDGASTVTKKVPDAFSNPALPEMLVRQSVGRLVVGGVYAEACVSATCRAALGRGYAVSILPDAIGARSEAVRRRAVEKLMQRGAQAADPKGRGWA